MPNANIVSILVLVSWVALGGLLMLAVGNPIPLVVCIAIGLVAMRSPRVARQWERAPVQVPVRVPEQAPVRVPVRGRNKSVQIQNQKV